MSKIVHISFYFSNRTGSEYIAAFEQNQLLTKTYGDSVVNIVSDIDKNIQLDNTIVLKSLITSQETLYKYTDFIPQFLWHFKVFLKLMRMRPNKVFISGLMPWHPIYLYALLRSDVFFLGVGGSKEIINNSLFEMLRKYISMFHLSIMRYFYNQIVVIPRTIDAELLWAEYTHNIKGIIPERVIPMMDDEVSINPKDPIKFVWIGQDIKRKNLPLALKWYNLIKSDFPKSELHVFGASRDIPSKGVKFHGWVNKVDLLQNGSKWVLLLSSSREGLASSVLEVLKKGGAIISKDIGSMSMLKSERVIITEDFEADKVFIIKRLKELFKEDTIQVIEENFTKQYKKILI